MTDAQGGEPPRPVPNTVTDVTPQQPATPRKEVVRRLIAEAWRFAGPLPPPEFFAEYNRILPGSAERILAMAEREQAHRHKTVNHGQTNEHVLAKRGQVIAGGLGGMIILVGALGVYLGRPLEGLGAVLVAAASLLAVFFVSNRAERSQGKKADENKPPS